MDSLGAAGMSAFPNDPKTQIMRQVQQEAAMQNARMLVEVHLPFLCASIHARIHFEAHLLIDGGRNSTNTALNAAFPSPAPLSPKAKNPVLLPAWKSTCPPGTRFRRPTSRGYRRSRNRVRAVFRIPFRWPLDGYLLARGPITRKRKHTQQQAMLVDEN